MKFLHRGSLSATCFKRTVVGFLSDWKGRWAVPTNNDIDTCQTCQSQLIEKCYFWEISFFGKYYFYYLETESFLWNWLFAIGEYFWGSINQMVMDQTLNRLVILIDLLDRIRYCLRFELHDLLRSKHGLWERWWVVRCCDSQWCHLPFQQCAWRSFDCWFVVTFSIEMSDHSDYHMTTTSPRRQKFGEFGFSEGMQLTHTHCPSRSVGSIDLPVTSTGHPIYVVPRIPMA